MKYRKRPVVIEVEAIQWTGDNQNEVIQFLDKRPDVMEVQFHNNYLYIVKEEVVLITQIGRYIIAEPGNTDTCFADYFEREFEKVI